MNGKQFTRKSMLGWCLVMLLALPSSGLADMHDMMRPRVPAEKLEQAQALRNPLPMTAEVAEAGKALYQGKGTCVNCHGSEGGGDGPAAASLNPSPRNFQHHGFWRHRTEGEIFWVIKHGSTGTAMIGFGDQLTDEEIWQIIRYEQTFGGQHGGPHGRHGRGMGGQGRMGMGQEEKE